MGSGTRVPDGVGPNYWNSAHRRTAGGASRDRTHFPHRRIQHGDLPGGSTGRLPAQIAQPWIPTAGFAEHGALYHKVQIDLEGIPLHAWETMVASDLLHPFCSVESTDPDTLQRSNLERFRVTARTTRPELIPPFRILAIPEPTDDEGPFRPVRNTLRYVVKITVRRLLVRLPPDSPPYSPPPTLSPDSSSEDDSPPQKPKRQRPARRHHQWPRKATPPSPATGAAVEYAGVLTRGELRLASGCSEPGIHEGGTQLSPNSGTHAHSLPHVLDASNGCSNGPWDGWPEQGSGWVLRDCSGMPFCASGDPIDGESLLGGPHAR